MIRVNNLQDADVIHRATTSIALVAMLLLQTVGPCRCCAAEPPTCDQTPDATPVVDELVPEPRSSGLDCRCCPRRGQPLEPGPLGSCPFCQSAIDFVAPAGNLYERDWSGTCCFVLLTSDERVAVTGSFEQVRDAPLGSRWRAEAGTRLLI